MISCRLLGPPDLTVDGGAPPAELLWRKNLALLVYLALSPRRAARGTTWSGSSGATSRNLPRGMR
jgi:DNA-binding SARP family transcriptional activator